MPRSLVLYIAMSEDGFIADKNEGLDFLNIVEKEGEDYGYEAFNRSVDTIIIGRKTYDKVLSMGFEYPHKDKRVYIISRDTGRSDKDFTFYSGDLKDLVLKLKSENGKDIYCDGGAEIAKYLINENLLDSIILSVIPVKLHEGIELFPNGKVPEKFGSVSVKNFDTGLIQTEYSLD